MACFYLPPINYTFYHNSNVDLEDSIGNFQQISSVFVIGYLNARVGDKADSSENDFINDSVSDVLLSIFDYVPDFDLCPRSSMDTCVNQLEVHVDSYPCVNHQVLVS